MKRAPKSAAKLVVLENGDPISAEEEAIQSLIRERAFEMSRTRPDHAHELYDWLMAKSEIISVPPVKLVEKDDRFEAKFALAGVDPEKVHVLVTSDQILVKGGYKEHNESDEGTLHLSDFHSATIFRSIDLPAPIDTKSVNVDFEDGMLRVTAFKQGASRPVAKPKRAAAAAKAPAKKKSAKP
jgi:HSP20 family molecular chaperone IbpA